MSNNGSTLADVGPQIGRNLAKKIRQEHPGDERAEQVAVKLEEETGALPLFDISPDELVYVTEVIKEDPTIHRMTHDTAWNLDVTLCGKPLTYKFANAILPLRHAVRFSSRCARCFAET